MKIVSKYKKGFTLLELIIAMALLGLIISSAYSLYFFATQSFFSEEKQYSVQSEARIVTDYIVDISRNATDMEIISITTAVSDIANNENYNYIYFDNSGGIQIYLTDGVGNYTHSGFGSYIDQSNSYFQKQDSDTFKIYVYTVKHDNNYSVEVDLYLSNFSLTDPETQIIGSSSPNKAIKFILP